MNIDEILSLWKQNADIRTQITCWDFQPSLSAQWEQLPSDLHPKLAASLKNQGVDRLYKHQHQSFQEIREGKNVVISTGTASGKTLCYTLPVLNALLQDPKSKALLLFPTKALSQDQKNGMLALIAQVEGLNTSQIAIYDGDTPSVHRAQIRKKASIVITNPDMLHQGILPHHTLWHEFFSGLKYVVLDEMHTYRGVFGSHVANVIRRLKRIAAFYQSYPQFILTSATIGNPKELAEKLIENPVTLIDTDYSPHGDRHFLIYNPPFVDERLGIRQSSIQTSVKFSKFLMQNDRQVLLFARTRRSVEMILTYLLQAMPKTWQQKIRGYRSGYLKADRREIEKGFKDGSILGVVSTSALELGIDIGDLDAIIMVGYPGSISTTRQRAGRAGRKQQAALAMLIPTMDAMDQYLASHPEHITQQNPEKALINPNNLSIVLQHLRCAAFELPFHQGEHFGTTPQDYLTAFFQVLTNAGELHEQGEKYYWVGNQFVSATTSLRSASSNIISLKTNFNGEQRVIGEIDAASAAWLVHPEAIYLHEAESFLVKSLDLEQSICLLEPANTDYYTIPTQNITIEKFVNQKHTAYNQFSKNFGEINLRLQVEGFRKVRWQTGENIGRGIVNLPPYFLETTGCWLGLSDQLVNDLRSSQLWNADPNDYGPGWLALKKKIIARDGYQCRVCGANQSAMTLHVHHIQPFKSFLNAETANDPKNLVTLCPSCHKQAEQNVRIRSGLAGASYALGNLAPLMVMCDKEDLGILSEPQSVLTDGKPAILVYDDIPGGLGLSEFLYNNHNIWIQRAREMIAECPCLDGCPACVGPIGEEGYGGKTEALAILEGLT